MNFIVEEFIKRAKVETITERQTEMAKNTFLAWDVVKQNYDDIMNNLLRRVVSIITTMENEIHVRVENRRKWDNTRYNVVKFSYLKDELSVEIESSIKSEFDENVANPVIKIPVEFVLNSHDQVYITDFYTEYETKLKKTVEESRKQQLIDAKISKYVQFKQAQEIFLVNKEFYEKLEAEILPFEEWVKTQNTIATNLADYDTRVYNLMSEEERKEQMEEAIKDEYIKYTEDVKMGII